MFNRIKEIVREGWPCLLVGYIFGYAIPLLIDGVPNIYYLIPIKAFAVGIGWGLGTGIYSARTVKQRPSESFYELWLAGFGHIVFSIFLGGIAAIIITIICRISGVDPTPFYGF